MIVPGGRYPYAGDVSTDADWLREPEAELVWRNVLVHEKLNAAESSCARIVRYKGRDAATAFPLLEKPGGGPLNKFLALHRARMYPEAHDNEADSDSIETSFIASTYLPLVYRCALQILSALSEIHRNGIIHMDIVSPDCFWLYEDLSIALVGFQSADFVSLKGERVQGNAHCGEEFRYPWVRTTQHERPTAKVDLFDWATLIYTLMTDRSPVDGRVVHNAEMEEIISTGSLPVLEEEKLGHLVKKCWLGEYKSASEIMADLKVFLTQRGFKVEEDDIRGYDFRTFL
ncbi:uncharacterized protein M437DRAFT_68022 [Aureobasidium melanogenum CBS 110374]|uniref:Protein kinase domain-containing protein n=1 Tax=Aureobasidium melanogenum (strain CBS 110374) TaxID=1043003 RepID=A0A074VMY0_AURM1|nr:uncharacterized protein M437DRAFT_68022 [Aureobasidium melanogenum CBS 110374]KEQ60474.1 hypothetical protein M437DRAFT_68022 [Aureobasidium melanogenum CBS 110374]